MAGLTWRSGAGRKLTVAAGAVLALALLAGGWFWFGGGYDRWVAQRQIDEACDGVLPGAEVRDVLGDGPFEDDTDGRSEGELADASLRVECSLALEVEEGSVTVNVHAVPERRVKDDDSFAARQQRREDFTGRYDGVYPEAGTVLPPATLGHGWNSVFSAGSDDDGDASATTAVLLDCARGRGGLLVTVGVEDEGTTVEDAARRTAFARIATATAANASDHWGCDAELGERPRTVPLPVDEEENVPLADATASCEGVPARGSALSWAWEGARRGTPLEVCVLGAGPVDTEGRPAPRTSSDISGRYRLSAYYGPYAQDERYGYQERHDYLEPDRMLGVAPAGPLVFGGYWASAECEKGGERALFTIEPPGSGSPSYGSDKRDKPSAADRAYQRAALKAFAEKSAETHGCKAPVQP
ncbi:hypothetical protein OG453_29885 [Streptomyces sp. NBC_01381]|uniref:hypothetical protein n=1 Tax=Streptomyces sp. NBC_01381 TaxID=2903845 RepID=UPI002253A6CF|nr:hypothetical protein [Streptomyces sp. NBC_01381]MCX4670857.1 hypothetical protein [Streptomyces sp. NBC_01381]